MRTMRVRIGSVAVVVATLFVAVGCGVGVDSYEEFESAVEQGADCRELFDQRSNFDEAGILRRIDAKLTEIGCDSPDSVRDDR